MNNPYGQQSCSLEDIQEGNLPLPTTNAVPANPYTSKTIVLGIEGSANKVGVGVLEYDPDTRQYTILSNPRKVRTDDAKYESALCLVSHLR